MGRTSPPERAAAVEQNPIPKGQSQKGRSYSEAQLEHQLCAENGEGKRQSTPGEDCENSGVRPA